ANYAAQGNFAGSSADGTLHVDQAQTSIGISAPTVTYNSDGTVTVTVSNISGTSAVPAGSITLSGDDIGSAQTKTLSGRSATFTITSPLAGDHSLHVDYSGDANFFGSSADSNLHVNKAGTSVAADAPTVTYNADGTVTVTVSNVSGTSGVPAG